MVDIETAIPEGSWVLVTAANGYTVELSLLRKHTDGPGKPKEDDA